MKTIPNVRSLRPGESVSPKVEEIRSAIYPSASGRWFDDRPSTFRAIAKIFFLLLVCAYFGFSYGSNRSFLNLDLYTKGLERTPYQYRVLPMYVFRFLMHFSFITKLAHHVETLKNDPYRLILMAIGFFGLLGAVVSTRLTIKRLTGDGLYAFWAALLVALMAQLQLSSSWGESVLPYDVPALFFFSLSIYLVISRRFWAYYLLFPFAVLNRETACFITVFFVVWEWVRRSDLDGKARLLRLAPHVVVQMIIWLAIKVHFAHVFAHNPTEDGGVAGGLFVSKIGYNLRELPKPQQWPLFASICGFSLPFLYLQRKWIRCDGMLYACAIFLPLSFAGMMIVGVVTEIRIFADWIAVVAPTIALIVHNRFKPVAMAEA
jgi:hypothetical protein